MLYLIYITLQFFLVILCVFVCYSHHTSAIDHNVLCCIFMVEFWLVAVNCYPPLITLLECWKQYYFVILHGNVTYKEDDTGMIAKLWASSEWNFLRIN